MNMNEAKAKLEEVDVYAVTRHPVQPLVGELCDVVKFLLNKIEQIENGDKNES